MHSTMMQVPLSVTHLLERGRNFFGKHEIVSALPDKSIARTRTTAPCMTVRDGWQPRWSTRA